LKLKQDRPFTDIDTAVRKLLEIANGIGAAVFATVDRGNHPSVRRLSFIYASPQGSLFA